MSPDITAHQAQRLWPRWFVAGSKPVKVDLGPAGSAPLVDISGGGFRVQSLAPLRRGAEVPVRIEVPEHTDPLQCSGVVVWSKPNGAAGIRFAQLNEFQQTILQGWLGELERAATNPAQGQVQDDFTSVVSQIRGAQLNSADALNLIVRRAKEMSAVCGVAIALGKPESMTCMASAGEAPPVGSAVPAVIGLAGESVFKRKMVYCEDSKNDPRVGRDSTFGSAVILPLVVNNEVRGILQTFSKRSYAFTASAIDSLEKLADAVVFVTHGIVTPRRLATTKASLPTSSTLGPKPLQPMAPPTAAFNAPTFAPTIPAATTTSPVMAMAKPATQGVGVSEASLSSVVSTKPSAVETVPIASAIAAPVVPLAKPKPAEWEQRPQPAVVHKVAPRWEEPKPRHSTAKWAGLVLGVAAVAGASGWLALHRHAQAVPVAAAEASTVSAPSPISVAELNSETMTISAPTAAAASITTAKPSVPTVPATVPVTVPKHEEKSKVAEPQRPAAPESEPIVLAANRPESARPMDLDEVVPVKLPSAIPGTGAVSQIALPTEIRTAPKLAPQPQVRTAGYLVTKVSPVYPPMARTARIQGVVELQLHITPEGTVDKVERLNGQPVLAAAAMDAVKQWRYEPARLNGKPVEMQTTIKMNFELPH